MRATIFDPVRRKRVALTPEEDVRQQLIKMLSQERGYPLSLMTCEFSIILNGRNFRGDLVIHNREGSPLMIAECKAPYIKLTRETFDQILTYNASLGVKHILLTNGRDTYFASLNVESGKFEYKKEIPDYNELSQK
jgi:hypothetical protein